MADPADCRKCRWRGRVVAGKSVACRAGEWAKNPAIILWEDAVDSDFDCYDFQARPVRRKAKGGRRDGRR